MQRGSTSRGQPNFKPLLLLFLSAARLLHADPRCIACHAKEVAGYAASGMARSLAPAGTPVPTPDGTFTHEISKTHFAIHGASQTLTRPDESTEQIQAFIIGSGNHAYGSLVQIGDHLFQSPLSFYSKRQRWDVAPGYELDPHPDFSRPVTAECLFCHAGKPLPIADSLNRYQPGVFTAYAITCDRCHGDAQAHLKNPMRGSILNPAKLSGALRAGICEQCHLTGEVRIPNPDHSITDFTPGHTQEEFYTTYIAAVTSGQSIKVVSHAEQLALSQCARHSGDKLWCGTCHNPHDKPAQPTAYFRDRCLSCHAATLDKAHAAPGRDCVACHMPQLPAKDGGHTAFTNHRIARRPDVDTTDTKPDNLTAWREPEPFLRDRNLALALVTTGLENQSSAEVIRGYRMLNRDEKDFPNDPQVLTSLASILMKGQQPAEALKRFEKVTMLKPAYAPYYVNLASALLALNRPADAARQLERALTIDPLLRPAVELLSHIYQTQDQSDKANALLAKYQQAMNIQHH